ncbi:MAG: MarR family transcriptional regulator [Firmicutes bacterium]|nr:MarR family transcriptional regulator [Bacillota bacterium]MCL5056951.1 MarR family transcriptional regulator [Actinomycetota bacterium]
MSAIGPKTLANRDRYISVRTAIEMTEAFQALEDLVSTHLARFGLSWPKSKALVELHMAGDPGLSQSELSRKLRVSRANITGLIDRLEKDGLVVRESHPSDKRAFRVCLTERAEGLVNAFLPVHSQFLHKAMSGLDTGEKESLISLLQKLKKGLDDI